MNKDVLVILNDNNMSIDLNVGALNEYLVTSPVAKRLIEYGTKFMTY